MLKQAFLRALRSKGWLAFPEWRLGRLPLEQHLARVFAAYEIDCVIDVGANMGQFRDLLRDDVGYAGPIVSFEPVGTYAAALKERASTDSAWRIFPWALGSRSQTQPLTLSSSPGLHSLLQPDLAAMGNLLPKSGATVTGMQLVTVRRLDEVFAEVTAGLSCRHVFLKLDTQGYDLEVIQGAGSALGVVAALQSELSMLPIYHGMPDYSVALQRLTDCGFAISGIFPVTHDRALRVIEMDCVMVKQSGPATIPDSQRADRQ